MYCLSDSALSIVAVTIPAVLLGCGRSHQTADHDAATLTGTGGDIVGTGTGGAQADTGGGLDGGAPATGGALGAGSRLGAGGTPSTGGMTVGRGGVSGNGGITGLAGSSANGGQPGTGGTTGNAGATASGGATNKGGATGGPTFPRKFVGNIDTRGSIRTDFTKYWDQFTPENAGKWAAVQVSSSSTYNWQSLDAMYKYCEDNNILFKEHSFIMGGAGQPVWMSNLTATTGPVVVQTWMKTFCDRYPNTRLIDVVNEPPPHTGAPRFADVIGGGNNTTWDWIANSFKWARQACPNAILILNDYYNLEYDEEALHTIEIANAIQKLDAPIDAIGCEAHYAEKLPSSTLKANIDLITSSTGLPVYITEYDINLGDDEQQRAQYADHFPMFMDHPNVKGITVWGYVVGATWRSYTGLVESDGTMRPAMTWLMGFLGR